MVKTIFLFLIILASILTLIPSAHSQTEKKTVTLPSGEVVCDLTGEWNALYEHYGPMQWVGNIKRNISGQACYFAIFQIVLPHGSETTTPLSRSTVPRYLAW